MAKEMTTPGKGQIQALFVSAGNPVLSVPNGDELEAALEQTSTCGRDRPLRQRHHPPRRLRPAGDDLLRARGLPAAVPVAAHHAVHPVDRDGGRAARRGPPGVGDHRGDREPDRRRRRRARGRCASSAGSASPTPRRLVDLLLRTGPHGDLFGLRRGGLSVAKLARQPARDRARRAPRDRRAAQAGCATGQARPPRRARDRRRRRAPARRERPTTRASRCA